MFCIGLQVEVELPTVFNNQMNLILMKTIFRVNFELTTDDKFILSTVTIETYFIIGRQEKTRLRCFLQERSSSYAQS